mgnify:CR=1 FL=1
MGKLSYKDKVNLYYDRKKHILLSSITLQLIVQFLEKLINKHGFESVIITMKKNK